jgi:hypothetical protein
LFDLQGTYYNNYNSLCDLYQEFKSFLIQYNENFRTLMKKTNKLNENLESISLKNEFASYINKEENKQIKDTISTSKNEIKILKNIFNVNYNKLELEKYKEEMENNKSKKFIYFSIKIKI